MGKTFNRMKVFKCDFIAKYRKSTLPLSWSSRERPSLFRLSSILHVTRLFLIHDKNIIKKEKREQSKHYLSNYIYFRSKRSKRSFSLRKEKERENLTSWQKGYTNKLRDSIINELSLFSFFFIFAFCEWCFESEVRSASCAVSGG